jgi:twitching motility protein PilT
VDRGASVIHIRAGDVLRARIEGQVVKLSNQVLSPDEIRKIALTLIPSESARDRIDEIRDYNTSWSLPGVSRFRICILRQRGSLMIVMRVIPWNVPTLEDLYLPAALGEIAEMEHGLVVVTGPTGSGKSTTQAAMVNWLNAGPKKHIITLEDPIEFLHTDDTSTITQREVGIDTESYHAGLRAALRQDPDVVVVAEMRDREMTETAIRAAELGQLVITTLNSPTTVGAINHLLAMFPEQDRELARIRIGDTLQAVVAQKLLPRRDQAGRIPAVEILRVTGAIRECILNAKGSEEIIQLVEQGSEAYAMQSFQQHLQTLVQTGMVEYEVARSAAPSPSDFELFMQTLGDQSVEGGYGL